MGAFEKVKSVFVEPIGRIKNFAVSAGTKVMEFAFEGFLNRAGGAGAKVMGILRKAGGAFTSILKDPVSFCGNLVGAVRGGCQKFSGNAATHLKNGLTGWLFGALAGAGLTLPAQFDTKGIVSVVLQVVGATYERLRGKLANKIGEQKVGRLEKTFDFLKTIVTGGLGTAWQKISEFAGNLQEMVMGGIKEWVMQSVITSAITKLISMFNPAGAIIQAAMAIYNTVMFFIERGSQVAALAEAVFNSIGTIAAGNVAGAANYVEQTIGRSLPVMISFLARLLGLGGVSEHIKNVIKKIQSPIENAMNKLANFIVEKGKSLLGKGKEDKNETGKPEEAKRTSDGTSQASGREDKKNKNGKEETDNHQVITESFSMAGESHTLKVTVKGNDVETIMASIPRPIQEALNEQKKTEQDLINSTSGAEQQKHITILSELTGIEAWYSTEATKIRSLTNKSQIGPGIKNLAEQLKRKIGVLGNTYGLKDFVYKSLGIHELLSTIQGQVRELRKHYNPSTPKGQNDGHNNTATAAEALGWSAPWGRHDTRTRTAEPILADAIKKLDDINRLYGVNVSMESDYVEGKEERDDCRLALSNPAGYLAAKLLKVDTAGNLVHL
jgi:hypothetical protein